MKHLNQKVRVFLLFFGVILGVEVRVTGQDCYMLLVLNLLRVK